jgi:dienelactone hydrolase
MKKINIKIENSIKKRLLFWLVMFACIAIPSQIFAICTLSDSVNSEKLTYFELADQPLGQINDARCSVVTYSDGQKKCRIRMRGILYTQKPGKYKSVNSLFPKYPAIIYNHGSEETFEADRKGCAIANYFVPKGYIVFVPFRRGQGDPDAPSPNDPDPAKISDKSTGRYIDESFAHFKAGALDSFDTPTNCTNAGCYHMQLMKLQTDQDVVDAFNFLKKRTDIKSFVENGRTEYAIAIAGSSYGGRVTVLANRLDLGHRAAVAFSPAAQAWGGEVKSQLIDAAKDAKTPVFYLQAKWDFDTHPTVDLAFATAYGGNDPSHGKLFMASIFDYPKPPVDPTTGELNFESVHTGFAGNPDLWGTAVLDFLQRNGVK